MKLWERLEIDPGLITNGLREDEMVVWDGISKNGNIGSFRYLLLVVDLLCIIAIRKGNITVTDRMYLRVMWL